MKTYEAISAINVRLQKVVSKLSIQKEYLIKENVIQREVIGQLKKLMECRSSLSSSFCALGHFGCRKNHAKFDFVKKVEVCSSSRATFYAEALKSFKFKPVLEPSQQQLNEESFYKNLVEKIDELQAKYGGPPNTTQKTKSDVVRITKTKPKSKPVRKYGHIVPLPEHFIPIRHRDAPVDSTVDVENNNGADADTNYEGVSISKDELQSWSDVASSDYSVVDNETNSIIEEDADPVESFPLDVTVDEMLDNVALEDGNFAEDVLPDIGIVSEGESLVDADDLDAYEYDDYEAIEYYDDYEDNNNDFYDDDDLCDDFYYD